MWFVFPQLRELGRSTMAHFYGIGSPAEARAYLAHPLLGRRLTACTEIVLASDALTLHEIFGSPDDVKFASSMTLFALAAGTDESVFQRSLSRWCSGAMDDRTVALWSALQNSALPLKRIAKDTMLTATELDAPAQVGYGPANADFPEHDIQWKDARSFASLREALHITMNEEPPPGEVAYIRAANGHVLRPELLEQLWVQPAGAVIPLSGN
jgi:uncharacterized protein (DUF1810 family)